MIPTFQLRSWSFWRLCCVVSYHSSMSPPNGWAKMGLVVPLSIRVGECCCFQSACKNLSNSRAWDKLLVPLHGGGVIWWQEHHANLAVFLENGIQLAFEGHSHQAVAADSEFSRGIVKCENFASSFLGFLHCHPLLILHLPKILKHPKEYYCVFAFMNVWSQDHHVGSRERD